MTTPALRSFVAGDALDDRFLDHALAGVEAVLAGEIADLAVTLVVTDPFDARRQLELEFRAAARAGTSRLALQAAFPRREHGIGHVDVPHLFAAGWQRQQIEVEETDRATAVEGARRRI